MVLVEYFTATKRKKIENGEKVNKTSLRTCLGTDLYGSVRAWGNPCFALNSPIFMAKHCLNKFSEIGRSLRDFRLVHLGRFTRRKGAIVNERTPRARADTGTCRLCLFSSSSQERGLAGVCLSGFRSALLCCWTETRKSGKPNKTVTK